MDVPRIVFLGTGEIAIPAFRFLVEGASCPVGLVTQPDRPAGRRRELKPPPIKEVALAAGIPVLQPEKIKDEEALGAIRRMKPDLIVVMAYGQILPKSLIEMAPFGCVNLHASLLPKYRGAACIQAAIDAGDELTGVTLMHVVPKLDAGDVILSKEIPIGDGDTAGMLHDRLAEVARDALQAGLPSLLDGSVGRTPQEEMGRSATFQSSTGTMAGSIGHGRQRESRGVSGPTIRGRGCFTTYNEGSGPKRLKIFPGQLAEGSGPPGTVIVENGEIMVCCGEGVLVFGEVQADGSRRMPAIDWSRGWKSQAVTRLD